MSAELVAIGASAGGFDAVAELLAALPAGLPAAVAVVLHIAKERPNQLAPLLATRCALPVREAEDKEPVEPGTVYVAPPDYHLLVERNRRFALSVDAPVHHARPSIDILFASAAATFGDRLLAAVLTGANEDGAEGLALVKARGGTTWVQDPAGAHSRRMPEAAIARARPDRILSLAAMARELRELRP